MNCKVRPKQNKYRLVSDVESNIFINLESTDLESAALEALEILGYSILIKQEPFTDEPD